MTALPHPRSQFTDLGRLITLIDGVFAVAMTLLVLDLKLPEGNQKLISSLKQMIPGFLVYLIVFASVAGYWTIHHGNFHHIAHGDGRLVVLSLINLLFVTLFPLVASIVGAHPLEPIATVCFSINGLLYCISGWATWSYAATNRGLVNNDDDTQRLQRASRIMLLVAFGLAVSIPLAFISVYLAYAIWIFYTPFVTWWARLRILRITQKSSE
jgi:TMEM175 potassium channel family protein